MHLLCFCTEGRCAPLPSISNAHTTDRVAEEGSNAIYHCDMGYRFPDGSKNYTVTCNGTDWNVQRTHCECEYKFSFGENKHQISKRIVIEQFILEG